MSINRSLHRIAQEGVIQTLEEKDREIERLQEENLLLKASEPMSKLAEDYGYKTRCEKAIEYIENKNKYLDKENYYQVFEYRDMYLIPLLDILKGSEKE